MPFSDLITDLKSSLRQSAPRVLLGAILGIVVAIGLGVGPVHAMWASSASGNNQTFTTGGLVGEVQTTAKWAQLYNGKIDPSTPTLLGTPTKSWADPGSGDTQWSKVALPSENGGTLRIAIPVKAKLEGNNLGAEMFFTKENVADVEPELAHIFDGYSANSGVTIDLYQNTTSEASKKQPIIAGSTGDNTVVSANRLGSAAGTKVTVTNDDIVTLVVTIVRDPDWTALTQATNGTTTVANRVSDIDPENLVRPGYTFVGWKGCPASAIDESECSFYDTGATDVYSWDATNSHILPGGDGKTVASLIADDIVLTAFWVKE